MQKNITFEETQYFRQWWMWAILIALGGLFTYACFFQLGTGEPFGDKPMSDPGLIVVTLLIFSLLALFWFQGLHTRVDDEGVHIKYRPFHRKWKTCRWEDIAAAEVKKFNPFFDYGGWGIKNGSYTVQGRMGALLKFNNRLTVMIGTQKPEAFREALASYGK